MQEETAEALAVWKKNKETRKQRNIERRERYKAAVAVWEKGRDAARKGGPAWTQKKPTQEKLEGPVPRPTVAKVVESEDDERLEDNEDNNDEED